MNDFSGDPVPEKRERGDLADASKVGRKALFDKIKERQERDDIAFILSTMQGRRFYWQLMAKCGIFEEPFTGNNTTFFNCGRGSVGRMLLADLNEIAPQAYLLMVEESKREEAKKT